MQMKSSKDNSINGRTRFLQTFAFPPQLIKRWYHNSTPTTQSGKGHQHSARMRTTEQFYDNNQPDPILHRAGAGWILLRTLHVHNSTQYVLYPSKFTEITVVHPRCRIYHSTMIIIIIVIVGCGIIV